MITRKQKEEKIKELAPTFNEAASVFFTEYRGLTVKQITGLRRDLQEKDCRYLVVKNTLAKLAAKEVGIEGVDDYLEGPTAIAISASDPIEIAKVLLKKAKELENLNIKAGILDGKPITLDQVKILGDIPSREYLLAQVCGTFQAPIRGLAVALKGNINNLVYALEAVKKQKEAS